MPSRIGAPKSHGGCTQCKARRKKCDETLPVCQRCLKGQRECSYAVLFGANSVGEASSAANTTANRQYRWRNVDVGGQSASPQNYAPSEAGSTESGAMSTTTTSSVFPPQTVALEAPLETLNFTNQEAIISETDLLAHFSQTVAKSLTRQENLTHAFAVVAPSMAIERPYLRYCLLAIAGHHRLVHEYPLNTPTAQSPAAKALRERVLHYQSQALSLYGPQFDQAASVEDRIAAGTACALLLMFPFAGRHLILDNTLLDAPWAINKASAILRLQAGTAAVFEWSGPLPSESEHTHTRARGQLETLFHQSKILDAEGLSPETQTALAGLETVFNSAPIPAQDRQVYLDALDGLVTSLRGLSLDPHHSGHRISWVRGALASKLADLVDKRKQECLLLIAHWAVAVNDWPDAWWEGGLGAAVIREVYAGVGEGYRQYLEWPLRSIS